MPAAPTPSPALDSPPFNLEGSTAVVVFLRANNIHILLKSKEGREVDVALSNTTSTIRAGKDGPSLVCAGTVGLLSAAVFRPFWMDWTFGRISVGRGELPGIQEFMSCQDPAPAPVTQLAFGGWGSWRLSRRFTLRGVKCVFLKHCVLNIFRCSCSRLTRCLLFVP